MTKLLFFAAMLVVFASANVQAQHENEYESKSYEVGEFDEIWLEGGFRVYLAQGDECSLTVEASDDDAFDYLKIRNDREGLRLKIDRKNFNVNRIKLYVTFQDLSKLNITGGINLRTKGYIDVDDLDVYVAGGAKIEMDLKAKDVKIKGEGGLLFELDGVAESLNVHLSGAGHVDADQLKTKDVDIKIEGVGTSSVYATDNLYAKIEGVGKVKYRGNPRVVKDIEGLGSVRSD